MGREYYLKIDVPNVDDPFIECSVEIFNVMNEEEVIMTHRFFNKECIKFKCENIEPVEEDIYLISIDFDIKNDSESSSYIDVEIIEIKVDMIESLKADPTIKQNIYEVIDKYLNDDFEGAITKAGIIGEHIAKELAKKTKKIPRDFHTSVNILTNHKMTSRTKINYNYLGSLLWLIYYIRNEKSHPNPKIEFDKSTSDIVIQNFSTIIKYLVKEQKHF